MCKYPLPQTKNYNGWTKIIRTWIYINFFPDKIVQIASKESTNYPLDFSILSPFSFVLQSESNFSVAHIGSEISKIKENAF